MRRAWSAPAALLALLGCRDPSDRDAARLVESYDARVVEAFRASDPRVLEPVAGAAEARRLAALIGVKADAGITLDASLLGLEVLGVERRGGQVVVHTEERWHYRDRRIGSGEQVGQEARDHYFVAYHLGKVGGRWVVDRIAFDRPPEVGRAGGAAAGPGALHGVHTVAPAAPAPRREAP